MISWVISEKQRLGPYRCLRQTIKREPAGDFETTLVGLYGEIWQYSLTHFKAYVYSTRIRNRHCEGRAQIIFPSTDLIKWTRTLKVPVRYPSKQLELVLTYTDREN